VAKTPTSDLATQRLQSQRFGEVFCSATQWFSESAGFANTRENWETHVVLGDIPFDFVVIQNRFGKVETYIGVSINGVPQNGWFIKEHPTRNG